MRRALLARLARSVSSFLGEAKRFPKSREGTSIQEVPTTIRVCSKMLSSSPTAFSHCSLLSRSAGNRCIDTFFDFPFVCPQTIHVLGMSPEIKKGSYCYNIITKATCIIVQISVSSMLCGMLHLQCQIIMLRRPQ